MLVEKNIQTKTMTLIYTENQHSNNNFLHRKGFRQHVAYLKQDGNKNILLDGQAAFLFSQCTWMCNLPKTGNLIVGMLMVCFCLAISNWQITTWNGNKMYFKIAI